MMPALPDLFALMLQDERSTWESVVYVILAVLAIGFRLFSHGWNSRADTTFYHNEDAGLNSGCWFNMLPSSTRHHRGRHLTGTSIEDAPPPFPEGLRQVYPPTAHGRLGGMGVGDSAPGRLPVIGPSAQERLGDGDELDVDLAANTRAGTALRRNRYQEIQHHHEQVELRWLELLKMLEILGDDNMLEGWQSIVDGPFGLTTALEQVREALGEARRGGISTARLVQLEAPLDTLQAVISHARQSIEPRVPEHARAQLRSGVLEYVRRELPQLRHNLFSTPGQS